MKAPRIMAVITSPGIPSDSNGIRVAPATPLLPASAAATPSTSPLPKLSFLGDVRLASLYEINAADVAPVPGIAPIIPPIMLPRIMVFRDALNSFQVRAAPVTAVRMCGATLDVQKSITSGIANSPIVETIIPRNAAMNPLTTEVPEPEPILVREKQISQKYSGGPKFSAIFAR